MAKADLCRRLRDESRDKKRPQKTDGKSEAPVKGKTTTPAMRGIIFILA